jgi:hypothetical protein
MAGNKHPETGLVSKPDNHISSVIKIYLLLLLMSLRAPERTVLAPTYKLPQTCHMLRKHLLESRISRERTNPALVWASFCVPVHTRVTLVWQTISSTTAFIVSRGKRIYVVY